MFPNNVEFFAREKALEREADLNQIRLAKQVSDGPHPLRAGLGRIVCRLGQNLVAAGEKLQSKVPAATAQEQQQTA
ncbi:MAG: hypothetical protein D6768_08965 [Chloroflexi bacterium]|nr:MAG: hypothetical protein D6768_08965 [Chloroflexota bacterium]